ncbi:MAG TPA: carboxypeptidase-like regulatory domain-containing protein, partial [Candidatus Polarisedimenticolia bacterium]
MSFRKSLLVLLAGCFLMLLSQPALAQAPAGIRGVVLDKDGAPIPGATVTITNEALSISQGAVTDAKGEFRIVPLPPGKNYKVRVAFPTMSTVTMSD